MDGVPGAGSICDLESHPFSGSLYSSVKCSATLKFIPQMSSSIFFSILLTQHSIYLLSKSVLLHFSLREDSCDQQPQCWTQWEEPAIPKVETSLLIWIVCPSKSTVFVRFLEKKLTTLVPWLPWRFCRAHVPQVPPRAPSELRTLWLNYPLPSLDWGFLNVKKYILEHGHTLGASKFCDAGL